MSKHPPFVQAIEAVDPAFHQEITRIFDLAMAPGELDVKTKILIALALDALIGSSEGVASLAKVARGMGITDAQMSEALRIAYMVAGNGVLSSAFPALQK